MEERLDAPSDRLLFLPEMTVQAMRDSRYRHPANAVAELIDNSIDAQSNHVEVLVQERQRPGRQRAVWRIDKLAVLDNGHGMSADTLVQALRFGGRIQSGAARQIGKYGMGLPTSSVSQCRRLDVWSWQSDINQAVHSYIDVAEIKGVGQPMVPAPTSSSPPPEWLALASPGALNRRCGTLVVWSDIDRITQRPETIFNQLEGEIGRIYRHFIDSGDATIRMAAFRIEDQAGLLPTEPRQEREIRPTDPLYLMANTTVPLSPEIPDPLFTEYLREEYPVTVGGQEEIVEVIYSIAKPQILGEYRTDLPGNRPYGQHARKNMGISVIRERREISLENYFVREGGGGSIPENRWWGCEVRFDSACDDLFGVDHNKQLVSQFATAMRYLDESDEDTLQLVMDLGDDEHELIYRVAGDIRNTTRAMMREITNMFQRRPRRITASGGAAPTTTEGKAEEVVQEATRSSIEAGGITQTQTDIDRDEQPAEERVEQLVEVFREDLSEEQARQVAEELVRDNKWYKILPAPLDGYAMFSFVSAGGALTMKLNIRHPVYRFIQAIEDDPDGSELSQATAVGILAMLLSWGRMEEDIEGDDVRMEVQERARTWGRMVSFVLREIKLEDEVSAQ